MYTVYTVASLYTVAMSAETRIGIRDARTQLGRLADEAHFRNQATVITKNDEPRAALVPYDWYLEMQKAAHSKGSGAEA